MAAYRAFREPQLVVEPLDWSDFAKFDNRRNRYGILWSFFENTAYRNVHLWAHSYKVQHGLYRYTRGIYNPAYRLATFHQTHLMGGLLDPRAGDGVTEPSALPIEAGDGLSEAEAQRLRDAIATVWKRSNWEIKKNVYTLWGTVFGDVGLTVVDDPERGDVYLEVLDPSTLADYEADAFGNVKAYTIEEARQHPEMSETRTVAYRETCERGDGEDVVFRTYLNDQPYAWPGQEDWEWVLPYGFVPLVVVKHYDVGLPWGWSEMHAGRGKFHEVDDLASKLDDQIRKTVDAPWILWGVGKASTTPATTSRDSETYQESSSAADRPYPGREEVPMLYGPEGGKAQAMVADLDVAAVAEYLQSGLLAELERDYPELRADIQTASGDASGRALRVARQAVESKVRMRRVNYDGGLVRAQNMAIAIAGWRGYDRFEGFGLDSYDAGLLEHSIGKRAVFAQDPLDDTEIEQAEWAAVNEAVKAGVPLEFYLLEEKGWEQEKVDRLVQAIEAGAFRGIDMDARPPGARPAWAAGEADEAGEGDISGEIEAGDGRA